MEAQIKRMPPKMQPVERRKRIEAWIDAGHGSCVLREPAVAEMVQNSLLHFDAQRCAILAWVVMPNHVHVLFEPKGTWTVGKIAASWKKFAARRICDYVRDAGSAENASQVIGGPEGPVWHREYWDRYIRNEYHLSEKIEYIHQNPVVAGLASRAEDWHWSSAHPRDRQSPDWHPPPGRSP